MHWLAAVIVMWLSSDPPAPPASSSTRASTAMAGVSRVAIAISGAFRMFPSERPVGRAAAGAGFPMVRAAAVHRARQAERRAMRAELTSSVVRRQLVTEVSGESKAGLYFNDRADSQALPV